MPPQKRMGRRNFNRPTGKREYRKLFVIVTEGRKTEREYFEIFNGLQSKNRVKCPKRNHNSAPRYVLKQMIKYLREKKPMPPFEAWIVVDADDWKQEELVKLNKWAQERDNRGFALSNPKFEYWLSLHFEEGNYVATSKECDRRLQQHIPGYDKSIDPNHFTRDRICEAVHRAKSRDDPLCNDWPRRLGQTTVYKLVELIFKDEC